jgi:hypothetical protein
MIRSNRDRRENTVGSPNWISTQVRGPILSSLIRDLESYQTTGLAHPQICSEIQVALGLIEAEVLSAYNRENIHEGWVRFRTHYREWNDVGYASDEPNPDRTVNRQKLIKDLRLKASAIGNRARKIINRDQKFNANLANEQISILFNLSCLSISIPGNGTIKISTVLPEFCQQINSTRNKYIR